MDASWEAMLSVANPRLRLETDSLSRRSMTSLSVTRCCISSVSFSCLSRSNSKRCDAACLCSESLSATALSKASRHVRSSVCIADSVSDTVHDLVLSRDVSCKLKYTKIPAQVYMYNMPSKISSTIMKTSYNELHFHIQGSWNLVIAVLPLHLVWWMIFMNVCFVFNLFLHITRHEKLIKWAKYSIHTFIISLLMHVILLCRKHLKWDISFTHMVLFLQPNHFNFLGRKSF